jgi:hypothetical protein
MTNTTDASRLKPLLIAAGALLALVLIAWGALQVLLPPARVLALAREQLATASGREVRLAGASVSLWPPVRAKLEGLALGEPGGLASGAELSADGIDIDVDAFALLFRRVVIRHLTLRKPQVHLLLRADGTTNWSAPAGVAPAPTAAAPAAAFDLAIDELSIRSAIVVVDDARSNQRTVFDLDSRVKLAIAGASRIGTSGHTTFSGLARGKMGAARRTDLDQRLAALSLNVDHRGTFDAATHRLALERLAIGLGRAEILFTGVVDGLGAHAVARLQARGDGLDFGELLHMAAAADVPAVRGISGSGRMRFDLAIDGPVEATRLTAVTGTFGVSDGAFRYAGAPAGVSALAFSGTLAPDSLRIPDLTARVADQPVRASIALSHFADPRVIAHFEGAFDLAAVGPLVAPAGTKLGGRATVNVSAAGRVRDAAAMDVSGRADLASVSVASPQLPKPMESVNGSLEFSGTRAAVKNLSGRSGKSSFTLDATVERPLAIMAKVESVPPADVTFELRSPYLDLGELLPPTPGPTLLPNAKGGGRVTIGRLIQQKLDVSNVQATVTFDPTHMNVQPFSLDGYGGRVSGHAAFDLKNPASPGFQVQAKVDSVKADALLGAWTPAKNLFKGSLSTTLDLSGDGTAPDQLKRSLTAIGLAAMTSGEFGPTPALEAIAKLTKVPGFEKLTVHDLHLPFDVRDGRVTTRDVVMHTASGDWKATGNVGFDGSMDYAVSALIPAEQVAPLGANAALAAGALADAQGRLHMSFRVTGNALHPTVALDARALGEELAGRAKSALGSQGQNLGHQIEHALAPSSGDTVPQQVRMQALSDSLKKIKGRDLLKSLFGTRRATPPAAPATAPAAPVDTTRH